MSLWSDTDEVTPEGEPAAEPTETQFPIELESIEKTVLGDPPLQILRPCSVSMRKGDLISIMGPSGSGKSTLLNILGLLDDATAGSYTLLGREVGSLTDSQRTALRARAIGFVFQSFHLIGHYTALENVQLGLLYGSTESRRMRAELSARALSQVGLGDRMHSYPRTLSGGEGQRVAIARALACAPQVLLCDEPTGNLDSVASDAIMAILRSLGDQNLVVVIVTHDPAVAAVADRRISITDGVLLEVT